MNIGLKNVDLSWNGFAQEGAKLFLKTLKENECLEELDLTYSKLIKFKRFL
jgi:hypothetical protein